MSHSDPTALIAEARGLVDAATPDCDPHGFYIAARSLVPALCDALEAANVRAEKAEAQVAALLAFAESHGHCRTGGHGPSRCRACHGAIPHHAGGCAFIALIHDTEGAARAHDDAIIERCAAAASNDRRRVGLPERRAVVLAVKRVQALKRIRRDWVTKGGRP